MSELSHTPTDSGLRLSTRMAELQRHWSQGLLRDSVYLIAVTVITSVCGYGFWFVVAHEFSPAVIGNASALIASVSLISILSELGMRYHLVQEIAALPDRASVGMLLKRAFRLALVTSVSFAAIGLAIIRLFEPRLRHVMHSGLLMAVFVTAVLVSTVGSLLDAAALGLGITRWALLRNALNGVSKVALVPILFLWLGHSVLCVLALTVGAVVISDAIAMRSVLRSVRVLPGSASSVAGPKMVGPALRQFWISIGGSLPGLLLPLLVVAKLGSRDNAYFSLTWVLSAVTFMVSPAISSAVVANATKVGRLEQQVKRAATYVAGLLIVPLLVLCALASEVLSIFGHAYAAHGTMLLRLAALSAIPDAVTNLKIAILRMQYRMGAAARLNGAMAIATLVLTWFLLPRMGISACGLAWIASQSGGACWALFDSLHRGEYRSGGLDMISTAAS